MISYADTFFEVKPTRPKKNPRIVCVYYNDTKSLRFDITSNKVTDDDIADALSKIENNKHNINTIFGKRNNIQQKMEVDNIIWSRRYSYLDDKIVEKIISGVFGKIKCSQIYIRGVYDFNQVCVEPFTMIKDEKEEIFELKESPELENYLSNFDNPNVKLSFKKGIINCGDFDMRDFLINADDRRAYNITISPVAKENSVDFSNLGNHCNIDDVSCYDVNLYMNSFNQVSKELPIIIEKLKKYVGDNMIMGIWSHYNIDITLVAIVD